MEVIALYFGNVRLDFNAVSQYVQLVKASLKIFGHFFFVLNQSQMYVRLVLNSLNTDPFKISQRKRWVSNADSALLFQSGLMARERYKRKTGAVMVCVQG